MAGGPVVFEDGRQRRDYTHIRDAVAAVELVLEHPDAVGQAFNVGSGQVTTVLEYAQAVLEAMGANAEPDVSGRYRLGDTRHVWSDTKRIRALGWRPTGTLSEIIRDYLAWIAVAPEGADWSARALARMEPAAWSAGLHSWIEQAATKANRPATASARGGT